MGFANEVFNMCSKYNLVNLWNGIAIPSGIINFKINASGVINPLRRLKNIVITRNLHEDLKIGRNKACSFASLFLSNPFDYQKNYHLIAPFSQTTCFASPKGRKYFIKAILHSCSFIEECSNCGQQYKDKLHHYLNSCPLISGYRKELYLKLSLYNFQLVRVTEK